MDKMNNLSDLKKQIKNEIKEDLKDDEEGSKWFFYYDLDYQFIEY